MKKSALKYVAIALVAAVLLILAALLPTAPHSPQLAQLSPPAAIAQIRTTTPQLAQQVYELLPDLPQENQYVNASTGTVSTASTLVSRLIQYHLYVKSRPPNYRLDWKLTLADYLGAHQWMSPATYPGADTLRTNPMTGDVAAIAQLDRAQRDQLVSALVSVFNASGDANSSSSPTPTAPSSSPSAPPVVTGPGAAQLLLP
jgi:hypothetical protein